MPEKDQDANINSAPHNNSIQTNMNIRSGKETNSFHQWKFGTLNVRSGKEKLEGARMYAITKEVGRANLSFCCLQEVRHRNTGKKLIALNNGIQYSFLWCGQKKR